jgi:hypothetical protein
VQFLDGSTHQDDNIGDGPGSITNPRGHNRLTTTGEINATGSFDSTVSLHQSFLKLADCNFNVHLHLGKERRERGVNMGHGLHRLTRARHAKLPVVITEGNTRPMVPLVAAKYASECNIAVRNHIPIFTHWKEYQRQLAIVDQFLAILYVRTFPSYVVVFTRFCANFSLQFRVKSTLLQFYPLAT